ncbi:hypothetical protein FQN54_002970 [Arachnomyces sp. PD_36]|nr:hypothetical protein FQN54_002970 [Arachnomyces sp. PD_36]
MSVVVHCMGTSDDENGSKTEPPEEDPVDPAELQEVLNDLVQDAQKATVLVWVWKAIPCYAPLDFPALETALGLFSAPNSSTLEELSKHKPTLSRESLGKADGLIFGGEGEKVTLKSDEVRDFLNNDKTLSTLDLWQGKDLDLLMAKACVTYLSLDDFRDLPLPTGMKGYRGELARTDPFLTYASMRWHRHIGSPEEAKVLEPQLNQILDPDQNNLVLWMDQSSGSSSSGARNFIRSRAEVAIKRDIPWLAAYLLDISGFEPEDLFPARDLARDIRIAPKTIQALIERKPDYYLPSVTKSVLLGAAQTQQGGFDVLRAILLNYENIQLPATVLETVAGSSEGDKILDFLFSRKEDLPITNGMITEAAGNNRVGRQVLELLFQKDPSIRVTESMIIRALYSSNELDILFDHDKEAPVNQKVLLMAIRSSMWSKKMRYILSVRPDIKIPPPVLTEAVELGRYSTVKLLFEHDKDLVVDEELLKVAAGKGGHGMDTIEFVLDQCDPSLVTTDVLLAATGRPNSPHKAMDALLRRNPNVEISDEVLIKSINRDFDGTTFDRLLEHLGREEVSHEVTESAIACHKRMLTWTWRKNKPTSLTLLQARVPHDPYLKQKVEETDLEPPPIKEPEKIKPPSTAIPDAASRSDIARVKNLLEEGIDVNASHGTSCGCDRTKGEGTALQRAAKQRDIALVKLLLEHGANPDLQEGRFGNPLQEAAMAGDLELVKILVEHKASINHSGGVHGSPLIAASIANDVNVARYLLGSGADINFTDEDGWTPYLHALASESNEVVRFLSGVDPSLAKVGELIALPPNRMIKNREKSGIGISEDGLTIMTDEARDTELRHRIRIRGDHPIAPTLPYYFEMTVVRLGGSGILAIGFGTKRIGRVESMQGIPPFHSTGLPGHELGSWGYHADDGHVFDEGDRRLRPECPQYGAGDVVGCGIDFASKTAFFTKNGRRLDATLYMISGRLFPMIGFGDEQTEVKVNFGDCPFMYQV